MITDTLTIEWAGVEVLATIAVENGYDGEVRQVRTGLTGKPVLLPRECNEGCNVGDRHDDRCALFQDNSHAYGY